MKKVISSAIVLFCQVCLLSVTFAGEFTQLSFTLVGPKGDFSKPSFIINSNTGEFSRPSFRVREDSDREFNTPSFSLAQGD